MSSASFTKKHLLSRSGLSYALYPAALLYAAYMRCRRRFLFPHPYRAPFKVISIGNLSCGGSGKTPIAIALAQELSARNWSVAYSSRGYKSRLEHSAKLIYDGHKLLASPSVVGDEAIMAALSLPGIPVFCGKRRTEVLQLAQDLIPNLELMILDDAFQHLKVARDVEIVVFDSEIGLGNGFVLPAGYLREGLAAISPNSICLLHQKPQGPENPALREKLISTGAKVYTVTSSSGDILHKDKRIELRHLQGKSISLVSAIAHPESFARSVSALGLSYARHHIFPDHYLFQDAQSINQLKRDTSDYLLCTAKDAGKLIPNFGDRLLILTMKTKLAPDFIQDLQTRLKA
jgi:tetraacyldisaccharide 4'-kinase